MSGRDIHEAHRVSSPLELLFDLTTVVVVAAAAMRLHHDIAACAYTRAVLDLLFSFFTAWWSWMNFAWFSSAYDTDDIGYRLATLVQMVGVLVMAASLSGDNADQVAGTLGYAIMRVALVWLWLRAAREHPERRATCRRYALGLTVLQGVWLLRVFVMPAAWALPSFAMLVALELIVPRWAERAGETPWHPHHIAERYSLFTIILLGECMAGAASAMSGALGAQGWSLDFFIASFSVVGLIVGLWWIYFLVPFAQVLHLRRARAFLWGYGHALVFIALAALDGVLRVVADVLGAAQRGHGTVPGALQAVTLTALTVVVFLATLWWLGGQTTRRAERSFIILCPTLLLAAAAIVAATCGLPLPWALLILSTSPAALIAIVMRRRHFQPEKYAIQ